MVEGNKGYTIKRFEKRKDIAVIQLRDPDEFLRESYMCSLLYPMIAELKNEIEKQKGVNYYCLDLSNASRPFGGCSPTTLVSSLSRVKKERPYKLSVVFKYEDNRERLRKERIDRMARIHNSLDSFRKVHRIKAPYRYEK